MSATPITTSSLKMPFDAETLGTDLDISQNDLDGAFRGQAGLFAHYGQKHVEMMRQEARAKMMLEVTEAKLDKQLRDEAAAASAKITEKQIEQGIARSPDYIKAVYAHNEAKAAMALASVAVESFKQRRDMLIQIGASERQELKGDLISRTGEDLRRRAAV
jgi:hypothetical protein